MQIGLVAPPFIPVPPSKYGGTELFIARLAEALCRLGHRVVVYANGESTVNCEVRCLYREKQWPLDPEDAGTLKNLNHTAWAIRDAMGESFDVIHVNDALAVPLSRFLSRPVVHTLHHPHDRSLSEFYRAFPEIRYVAISDWQRRLEPMPRVVTIYHGVSLDDYRFCDRKQSYLSFLGRIAPCKGPHLAIEVARRTGIPLKIAGEVQPMFRDYWESQVKPHIDGRLVEYLGEADHAAKNELLSNSMALLFTIQWKEPFGLVMIESMACGTPVIALPGGSVEEVVRNGVSGWICRDLDEVVARASDPSIPPASCRRYVAERFSVERMARQYAAVYEEAAASPRLAATPLDTETLTDRATTTVGEIGQRLGAVGH